jgi:hypothetical protein
VNADEKKRAFELSVVQALNDARGLGLTDLRSPDTDPPDVEGRIGDRRIGIEVTQPVEETEVKTLALLKRVVLPEVEVRAASAAPGQAAVGTFNIALAHLERPQLLECAGSLADVVLQLAAVAVEPRSEATAASGQVREILLAKPETWNLQLGVKLPLGFDLVRYTRLAEGTRMEALWIGGTRSAIFGPGLDTTAERIKEKAAGLVRWPPGYDERWLLIPSLANSRTSVQQVQHDDRRFRETGFDKIWIIDTLRSLEKAGEDLPVNACRLDIHEE